MSIELTPDTMNPVRSKGFHMKFDNGWTVSVQVGDFNYADESETAEVAAWDADGKWYTFGNEDYQDTVLGWQTADQVADFIALIKAKP